MKLSRYKAFTLIEVLLALSIIAIAMTALLKATKQNISTEIRLKSHFFSLWIAEDALAKIQMKLVTLSEIQPSTFQTKSFGKTWYWRAQYKTSPIKGIRAIDIEVAEAQAGPYHLVLKGYE
jgi:general secretion pathway protein I